MFSEGLLPCNLGGQRHHAAMPPRYFTSLLTLCISTFCVFPLCASEDGPYHSAGQIAVGGEGGWDLMAVDSGARRLYVSHASKVVVIDLDKGVVAGEIADTPGVHGFAVAPELGRGFSTNGRESKTSIVDLKTLNTLSKVDTGANPDAIIYEPGLHEIYCFNAKASSATVIGAGSGKVVATIPLPGKPELAACDPVAGFVYCNLEDKSAVTVIDTKKHEVVNTWPLAPGEEPTGMAIDLQHHRLFMGCHNKQMVMMDSTNGKVVATVPIGAGVDGAAFDPETQYAFTSNGEGTVTVAHEETPDKLVVVQTLKTAKGARTIALDPKTHSIYLPAKDETGSMNVLVYTLGK